MGAANLYVAFNFSESAWVIFKTFGATGLTVAFVVIQMLFVFRYVEEEKPGEEKP
jgi:intracellular septation protein